MRKFLFLALQLFTFSIHAEVAAIADRYVGIFRHEKLQRDQLAKLDVILSKESDNATVIRAVLTLHFGDFKSGEYVAFDFDDVKYSILEKAFIFSNSAHGITLLARTLSALEFSGEFTSAHTGQTGTLRLRSDAPAKPELPLFEAIQGEYRGNCLGLASPGKSVPSVVQLYTYRSNVESTESSKNAFSAYNIKGYIAEDFRRGCPLSPRDKTCVVANYDSGTYNFFENQLFLYCNNRDMGCIPQKDGLTCERCDFLKRVTTTLEPPVLIPPSAKSAFQPPKLGTVAITRESIATIGGLYRGHIHHEYLDIYQPGQLQITAFQTGTVEDPQLTMSANGTLYFGGHGSAESIVYKFAERVYPKPLNVTQFVFDDPDRETGNEAIVQVTHIGDGFVKGVWFSRLFGRVGNFEFQKDGLPQLPNQAETMGLLAGNYAGPGEWEFDLLIRHVSSQTTTNPFSPLTFAGYRFFRAGGGGRKPITGGSYDFYTGKFGLEADDIAEENIERATIGQRVSRKRLLMRTLFRQIATPMEPFGLEPYRLMGARN